MKKLVFISLILFNAVCSLAAEKDLFYYQYPVSGQGDGIAEPGVYPIGVDPGIFELPIGSERNLNIVNHPGYTVVHDNKTTHKNGDISWFGYIKEFQKGFRVYLIKGEKVIRGQIDTPEGRYLIRTRDNVVYLESIREKGWIERHPDQEDFLIPELPSAVPSLQRRIAVADDDGSNVTVDIMILYNREMIEAYPGSQLETRFNEIVSTANQVNIDSNVNVTFRLVHTAYVNVLNTVTNSDALSYLTDGVSGFSSVSSLRTQYGADLVVLIRPYDATYHGGCGLAWLNGYEGTDISLYSEFGYSVISDGSDGGTYCDDYTMVHELGHNMGCAHDRDHASDMGAYSYSYGHDVAGLNAFGTIMSYDGPTLGYFSNPDINECNGLPCGVDINSSNAANNALSLNNTRFKVAAFKNETVDNPQKDEVIITGLSANTRSNLVPGDTVTFTVNAANPGDQTLYYKFYYKADYGTPSYETNSWEMLQDYSVDNSIELQFNQAGSFIIVVRVVLDPNNEPESLPIIGQVITVGDPDTVNIQNLTRTPSQSVTVNNTVTFSVDAFTDTAKGVYYKFFYRANYGTANYDTTPWTVMQDYSTSKSCQHTFPSAGDYIVVARAVTDPLNEPAAIPISGTVIHVE